MAGDIATESKPRRRCAKCGGEMRFSHREYAGRGTSSAVLRCTGCGDVIRDSAREAAPTKQRHTSKRHRDLDAGPLENPVIDPELAARLLESTGESN
jgi:hypothetical protein